MNNSVFVPFSQLPSTKAPSNLNKPLSARNTLTFSVFSKQARHKKSVKRDVRLELYPFKSFERIRDLNPFHRKPFKMQSRTESVGPIIIIYVKFSHFRPIPLLPPNFTLSNFYPSISLSNFSFQIEVHLIFFLFFEDNLLLFFYLLKKFP